MCKMYNFPVTICEVSHSSMILHYFSTKKNKNVHLVVVSHTWKENRLGQYTSKRWETDGSGYVCPNIILLMVEDHDAPLMTWNCV